MFSGQHETRTVEEHHARGAPPFLMISGNDFRSKRRVKVHFIAEELARRGRTRFFSIGFSLLSKMKRDPRSTLWKRANAVETCKGVDAYLWRSLVHPFNLGSDALGPLAAAWFRSYAKSAPATLRHWIAESNTIILESGMAVIFFDLIKRINPSARVIYIAADALHTLGCSPFLIAELARVSSRLDGISVPSTKLASEFPDAARVSLMPRGFDLGLKDIEVPTPYSGGTNVVSVGSMLFDRSFFEIACRAVPEVTFHVIGAGVRAVGLAAPNLIIYDEMPFMETLAYIRHADAGIAPYASDKVAGYLVDTSMKLIQYGFFGIPAICPHVVVGEYRERFGYEPGDKASIEAAVRAAIAFGHFSGQPCLSWAEVTERVLDPARFTDTHIGRVESFTRC